MEPKIVFDLFEQINKIPRPSKKEQKMIDFLCSFAEKYKLDHNVDNSGNVIILCPPSPGYENAKGVVIQAHMDMVCEKLKDLDFDFNTQPIETYVDGEWLKAKGTTLGADDGIGVAMALSLVVDENVKHGPLELFFTSDEESGMTGAFGLKPDVLKGKYLINLDSEDEGEFFIGCAGGQTTDAVFDFETVPSKDGYINLKIEVDRFKGGHSGDDINKNRANAIKILIRFLYDVWNKYDAHLIDIVGGKLHNAIPRYAEAVIAVPYDSKEIIRADFNVFAANVQNEYHKEETECVFKLATIDNNNREYIQKDVARNIIFALQGMHNGVLEMNQDIKGLVETSSNLASIKKCNNHISVIVSQRSSTESALDNVSHTIEAMLKLAGAKVKSTDRYPGWQPNTSTEILKVSVDAYNKLFEKEPIVRAIHAGLECGLFSTKYPEIEMISFGPTLRDVHTPNERLLIPTVDMAWKLLIEILENLK